MQQSNRIWLSIFFVIYAATFLPHFGVLNNLSWVGPLPQPMAWVLFLNAINTAIVFVVYIKFFKPYAERMETKHNATVASRESERSR